VRRAREGERLTTLDGVDRTLDPDDLLITDDSGPIGLAGGHGRRVTEIGDGHDRRAARGGALGADRWPAPPAGTGCPARRPSGSSAASTRR
jgi:hypothetical protein